MFFHGIKFNGLGKYTLFCYSTRQIFFFLNVCDVIYEEKFVTNGVNDVQPYIIKESFWADSLIDKCCIYVPAVNILGSDRRLFP